MHIRALCTQMLEVLRPWAGTAHLACLLYTSRAAAAGEGECAMEILRVEDVGPKYQAENGEVTAFEHISCTVQKGEFMSIVGQSGCGKSTLLSIIAGLLPPTSGRDVYKRQVYE